MVLVGNKADLSPDRYGNLCSLRRRKVSWTRNEPGSCRGSATDLNQSFYLFISNLKGKTKQPFYFKNYHFIFQASVLGSYKDFAENMGPLLSFIFMSQICF